MLLKVLKNKIKFKMLNLMQGMSLDNLDMKNEQELCMKKTVLICMVVAVLMMTGCGGSSGTKKNDNPGTSGNVSKETESLAKSILFHTRLGSNISSASQTLPMRTTRALAPFGSDQVETCENGGTFTMSFSDLPLPDPNDPGFNPEDFNSDNFSTGMRMSYDNCLQGGMITDGTMEMNTTVSGENNFTTRMTYLTDFTMSDGSETFKILKGSYVIDEMSDDSHFTTTETMTVLFGNERYESRALQTVMIMDESAQTFAYYPVSGEERFGGTSYRVDESYDASKTPMVIDSNGDMLKGGKFRYIDDQNRLITVEVTQKNKMTVSIDTDGDGKADETETMAF